MLISRLYLLLSPLFKTLLVCFFVLFSIPGYAAYYSGHHYGHGYGHYGYPHYRHHYGYGHHYGHHSNYGVHGYVSGDAAYVILGLLGVAILSNVVSNNRYRDNQYRRTYSYNKAKPYKPSMRPAQAANYKKTVTKLTYFYNNNEGWDWLAKGNANYALDIFAVQSQQSLNSGIPKVGFAIAAATNGDMDRATRAMRKAIRIDAAALDKININNIKPDLEALSESYKLMLNGNKNNTDNAFMVAALSYLQKDYAIANDIISENDQRQSTINLRELIKNRNR
jgi:hypothetical protein